MHVKRRPRRNGQLRDRSYNRMAFEAFLCYVMSTIGLSASRRKIYREYCLARGFDVPLVDPRSHPAPKPPAGNAQEIEAWIRENICAKGWDRVSSRPLLVKSDLVSHGGRACRTINGYAVLSMSVEFLGSCFVRPGVLGSPFVPDSSRSISFSLNPGTLQHLGRMGTNGGRPWHLRDERPEQAR